MFHPGFKAAQKGIAQREGMPEKEAGAILAAGARKASPAAKKANPRLDKVVGVKKKKKSRGHFRDMARKVMPPSGPSMSYGGGEPDADDQSAGGGY